MTTEITGADDACESEATLVLADERRRETFRLLREAGSPLSVMDLAVELAGEGTPTSDAAGDRVRDLRIQLYHRDLPRLADAGLVEFDSERRVAVIADAAAAIPEDRLLA